jgi:hypothetical protein
MDAKPDRRLYEIATLAVLRERLRSGDIWIEGSHAFRPMDEQLMPKPAFAALKASDDLGLGVPQDAVTYLSEARQTLDFNLKRLAYRARNGKLEGVRLEAGQLVVTPLPGDVPTAAEELKWELADMYPLIEVPDLLMEVHAWTGFADRFTHIRTQEAPRSIPAMLAGVLADATNLGARRMASASKGVSPQEIAPRVMITDKMASYAAAKRTVMPSVEHRQHRGLNNRAENSHQPTRRRERIMKRFKSAGQAQRFLSVHDQVTNLFRRPAHINAEDHRCARARLFRSGLR